MRRPTATGRPDGTHARALWRRALAWGGLALLGAVPIAIDLQPQAALARDSCAAAPAAGGHGYHIHTGGVWRFYKLHVPPGVAAGVRLPLVMVLHGAGGNAPRMEKYTGFSKLADQHGFAVVYPQASAPLWNITESRKGTDDVGFIGTMLSDLEQTICVDSDRVYAAGVSNGGGMVALLGCALSDRIAAIAPVEGDYDDLPACRPPAPLSVLEIHGTADPIAPYFGHRGAASAQGVPPFVKSWIHREGCAVSASTRAIASRTLLYQWSGCAGVSVEHIRIRGGRHQWPGATPPDPGPPSTICAACTIWDFFSGLPPRPSSHTGGAGLPIA